MTIPRQITNAAAPNWAGNEYSAVCPFNCDNSQLILVAVDHFILCDGDGVFQRDLPIAAAQEPRWSRTDPDLLYYLTDSRYSTPSQIRTFNVASMTSARLQEFPEYVTLTSRGETDISADGQHLVLLGTRKNNVQEVLVYDLQSRSYPPPWILDGPIDGLKISPSNHPIISKSDGLFIREGTTVSQLTQANGHATVARYGTRDVLLWCSAADKAIDRNALVLVNLSTYFQKTSLLEFIWDYAFHISPCTQRFCLVSTYSKRQPLLPMQLWKVPLSGEPPFMLVSDTGGQYREIAGDGGYTSQPKAALSRDGSRAVYSVHDGTTVNTWLMELDAPATPPMTKPIPQLIEKPADDVRIDYAPYVGKSEFVLRPRPDGAVDIFERKLK